MSATATRAPSPREPSKNLAWLRRETRDPRRRRWTPRRLALLRLVAAEPYLTFAELGERLGINPQAAWALAQRCMRDGLLVEHRPTTNGRPSRRAVYRITEDARRVVERKESK
ncbi:MAG: winged helix-turn-helix domain-containing protein [Phycisphaerae bacterium]|nr:winged helix-turn-helix domain-containing protein [Phycisphaerae bacterium]